MKILKFGDTSIGSVEAICQVIQIIKKQKDNSLVLLFSAFGTTTNDLLNMAEFATDGYLQKELKILKQIKRLEFAIYYFVRYIFISNK